MSALCHVIPYLYYSTLISLYLFSLLSSCAFFNSEFLLISKCVYLSFYIIRIASLQGNHGYFLYEVVNKKQDKTKLENITIVFYSIMYYHPFLHYTTLSEISNFQQLGLDIYISALLVSLPVYKSHTIDYFLFKKKKNNSHMTFYVCHWLDV